MQNESVISVWFVSPSAIVHIILFAILIDVCDVSICACRQPVADDTGRVEWVNPPKNKQGCCK